MEDEVKKGKAAFLAKMQENDPEYNPQDDDELWGKAEEMYNTSNGELEKHRSANSKLGEFTAKDPRFGAVLSMVSEGKSYPYAHAKMYGKEALELEGDELEEWEAGYQENLLAVAESDKLQQQAQENFVESMGRLKSYCDAQGYDEAKYNELYEAITTYAEDMLMGKFADSLFAEVDKGKSYDEDIQEAAETGKVEGLNQKIDMKLEAPQNIIPDMASQSMSKTKVSPSTNKSFYAGIKKA